MNDIWWKFIPNARMFIDDIAQNVLRDESVIYVINGTFPWKEQFINELRMKIEGSSKELLVIEADNCDDKLPGDYLISRFCKPELRSRYRASVGTAKFLAQSVDKTILIDRFVMITNCSETQLQQWCDFIAKYNSVRDKKVPSCCFLLECQSDQEVPHNLFSIVWDKYYHLFDINMYCMLLTSNQKINSYLKSYIAELSVLLCKKDVELASELTKRGSELISDPKKTVEEIVNESLRSNNQDYSLSQNISSKIWEAQVKLFFPIIEKYRMNFIERHIDMFPSNLRYETVFGDCITDVHDLELGMIKTLCSRGDLYISSQEYKELDFYRMCRNKLAHTSCLSLEEIKHIIENPNGECKGEKHRILSYV